MAGRMGGMVIMAGRMGGMVIMAGRMGGMVIMAGCMGATGVIMGFSTRWTGGVCSMILRMLGLRVLMTWPSARRKGTFTQISLPATTAPSPCSVLLECAACSS